MENGAHSNGNNGTPSVQGGTLSESKSEMNTERVNKNIFVNNKSNTPESMLQTNQLIKKINEQKTYQKQLLKESKKLQTKQKEIDRLVQIIERLRKYHMNDVVPSKLRRSYLTELIKKSPKHPKLKVFLPYNGKKFAQTTKSKVASNLVRNLKNTKQDISIRMLAKFKNLKNRYHKYKTNKTEQKKTAKQHAYNLHQQALKNKNKKAQNKRNLEIQKQKNKEYNEQIMKALANLKLT